MIILGYTSYHRKQFNVTRKGGIVRYDIRIYVRPPTFRLLSIVIISGPLVFWVIS